jgi:uncharacterized DUF497 family protein
MDYEWDEAKAAANFLKHGVLFADAVGVFEDEAALSREDPFAQDERRFVATGLDFLGRVLTVVYTFRPRAVRLISAREATRRERHAYEQRRF